MNNDNWWNTYHVTRPRRLGLGGGGWGIGFKLDTLDFSTGLEEPTVSLECRCPTLICGDCE